MIRLTDYRQYWERMAAKVEGLRTVMPVTADEGMGRRLQSLGQKDTPALFYLPPIAESRGDSTYDWEEVCTCVVFVMDTYDSQRSSCYDVLERVQPVVERLKGEMIEEIRSGCPALDIDVSTIDTMPETEFYRTMAGWSVSFKCRARV